jgi:hypothetical protein
MKKSLTILALLAVFSLPVFSAEEEALQDAPADYIKSVLETCKAYAVEDEVDAKDLETYLLECVNEDLEANNYKLLKALPKQPK